MVTGPDRDVERRTRDNAIDELRGARIRLNHFLLDDGYRKLLTFAELKMLSAASDVMSGTEIRLMEDQ